MINIKSIAVFLLVFGLCAHVSKAQLFSSYFVSGGLTGVHILGDNPGQQPFVPDSNSKGTLVGGNFTVIQSGFDLRFTAQFNRTISVEDSLRNSIIKPERSMFGNKLRFAGGINYTAFRAHESEASAYKEYNKLVHSLDQINIYLGLEWIPIELYWARARVVLAGEMWNSFFIGDKMSFTRDNVLDPTKDTAYSRSVKDDAYRIGAGLRLGVEGDLKKNVQVTTGVRLGALNLLLRDDSRFELLTPYKYLESGESIVSTLAFYFSVQYKF